MNSAIVREYVICMIHVNMYLLELKDNLTP